MHANNFKSLKSLTALTGLSFLTFPAHSATITSVGTTGIFDESTGATNALDAATPAGSLPPFTASVLTAYNNNLGGVIDWETGVTADSSGGPTANNTLTTVSVAYGLSGTSTLNVAFDAPMDLYTNNINSQVRVLSGSGATSNALIAGGGNDPSGLQYTMTFSGALIGEIGAAFPSRSTYGPGGVDFQATANFSGGGSDVIDRTIGGNPGNGDTFFYFAAPGGENITSLTVAYVDDNGQSLANGQRRPVLDDVGFVVAIPEASSTLTLGLACLSMLGIRRR